MMPLQVAIPLLIVITVELGKFGNTINYENKLSQKAF